MPLVAKPCCAHCCRTAAFHPPCSYSDDALRSRGVEALRPADRAAVQASLLGQRQGVVWWSSGCACSAWRLTVNCQWQCAWEHTRRRRGSSTCSCKLRFASRVALCCDSLCCPHPKPSSWCWMPAARGLSWMWCWHMWSGRWCLRWGMMRSMKSMMRRRASGHASSTGDPFG